jgi:toxin ParE1/3/4
MKLQYRRRALRDIDNIHEYIAERNPRAAREVLARIRSAADRLGTWPRAGHIGRARDTYEWVVVGLPYIIAMKSTKEPMKLRLSLCFTAHKIAIWTNLAAKWRNPPLFSCNGGMTLSSV